MSTDNETLKNLLSSGQAKIIEAGMAKAAREKEAADYWEAKKKAIENYIYNVTPVELLPYLYIDERTTFDDQYHWYYWYLRLPESSEIRMSMWAGINKTPDGPIVAGREYEIAFTKYMLDDSNPDSCWIPAKIDERWSKTLDPSNLDVAVYRASEEYTHNKVLIEKCAAINAEKDKIRAEKEAEELRRKLAGEQLETHSEPEVEVQPTKSNEPDMTIYHEEYGQTFVYFSPEFWRKFHDRPPEGE